MREVFVFVSHLTVPAGDGATHTFLTAWKDTRTEVRHEAYDVLMDSRQQPEWLG